MSYYAKPMKGHSAEEIQNLLLSKGVKTEIIEGIVVIDTEEDPPPELEDISYVTVCVDTRFTDEF